MRLTRRGWTVVLGAALAAGLLAPWHLLPWAV